MELNRFQNILQRQSIIPEGFVSTLPLLAAQNQALEQVQLFKANLEQQLLKEQILKLLALKNELMHQTMNKIILKSQLQPNSPSCLLGELPSLVPQFSHSPVNSDHSFRQNLSPIPKTKTDKLVKKNKETQKETLVGIKLESSSETTNNLKMRAQLRAILSFLVANFGKKSEDSIESERKKYQSDKQMLEVFDILVRKYSGASKSREEMIKYILRKALRAVKNTIQKKMEIDSKEASSFLCKRYFNQENESLNEKEAVQEQKEVEDEEEDLLKASLPFRKNSKNKTMNANFLTEIFSSDQFCKDYDLYLSQIDEILSKDNEKKIDAFLTFLENCVKKNQVSTIKSCKRMPWLQVWLESTKNLAFELSTTKSWVENRKKVNLGLE